MLLNVQQCTWQLLTTKTYSAPNFNSMEAEKPCTRPYDSRRIQYLKCGGDISLNVPSQILMPVLWVQAPSFCPLITHLYFQLQFLGLCTWISEALCAEPKFAINPCYFLNLATRDSFDQKRNNTASQCKFHSFTNIFWVPTMTGTVLGAGE